MFILSIDEVEKYLKLAEDKKCQATPYAVAQGADVNDSTECCFWWVRSPGWRSSNATSVTRYGLINFAGSSVLNKDIGVRPAIWIDLN